MACRDRHHNGWRLSGNRSIVTLVDANEPYALARPDEIARRVAMLQLLHIKPLTAYLEKMRHELGPGFKVPYFDPMDGGILLASEQNGGVRPG